MRKLPEITFVEFDTMFAEHLDVFFAERAFSVMLLLELDISLDAGDPGTAHCEGPVSLLPGEIPLTDLGVNPDRGRLLQVAKDIRDSMNGPECHDHVNMVVNTTDTQRDAFHRSDDSAQVGVQTGAPLRRGCMGLVFCY